MPAKYAAIRAGNSTRQISKKPIKQVKFIRSRPTLERWLKF
jgi:hypothetical protein